MGWYRVNVTFNIDIFVSIVNRRAGVCVRSPFLCRYLVQRCINRWPNNITELEAIILLSVRSLFGFLYRSYTPGEEYCHTSEILTKTPESKINWIINIWKRLYVLRESVICCFHDGWLNCFRYKNVELFHRWNYDTDWLLTPINIAVSYKD